MLGKSKFTVGSKEVPVVGVERTVHSVEESPTTWQSYYLLSGLVHNVERTGVGIGASSAFTSENTGVPSPKLINFPKF